MTKDDQRLTEMLVDATHGSIVWIEEMLAGGDRNYPYGSDKWRKAVDAELFKAAECVRVMGLLAQR